MILLSCHSEKLGESYTYQLCFSGKQEDPTSTGLYNMRAVVRIYLGIQTGVGGGCQVLAPVRGDCILFPPRGGAVPGWVCQALLCCYNFKP